MSYHRVSRYYPGEDGTQLAVDIYLPDTQEKVPFLLQAGYEKRRRRFEHDKETMEAFLEHGYAIVIVEVRGSGASYGVSDGFFGLHDGKDLKKIIDTLAKEEWCNGCAGTFGGSNYGMSQEITAAEQPEALKAVCPCDCSMDFYDQDFPNGASALPEMFGSNHHQEPEVQDPVDDDPDGKLRDEAVACHVRNLPFLAQHVKNMYRDDVNPQVGYKPNLAIPVWERMDVMRFGHVKPFSFGAWFDPGCTNKILTYKSWGGRLTLGPWPHCGIYRSANYGMPNADYDWVTAHLRWFDRHLKGQANDIEEEPPVRYYTVGDTCREWKYEEDFPVEGTMFSRFHLGKDTLSETETAAESIPYQVRNDVMIYGRGMRMDRNVTKDMQEEDAKSLCFTSDVLPEDMEITGIPMLDLYVKSTHPDGNFIAVLEEVTPDGVSHFLTEGVIRASHAKTHRNPTYDSMGLPYHRGYREDRVEIPLVELCQQEEKGDQLSSQGEKTQEAAEVLSSEKTREAQNQPAAAPLKLSFHLEALSRIVKKGSRIRLAISCGGSGYQQPEGFPTGTEEDPLPTVYLYTGKETDSCLTLPVVRSWETHFALENVCEDGKTGGCRQAEEEAASSAYKDRESAIEAETATTACDAEKSQNYTDSYTDLWLFRTAVFLRKNGRFMRFPVNQVYPAGKIGEEKYIYETESFLAVLELKEGKAFVEVIPCRNTQICSETSTPDCADLPRLKAEAVLPKRYVPADASREIPVAQTPWSYTPPVSCKDLYVATVPVKKGDPGNMNPMQRKSFDLFIDLIYPEKKEEKLPVIVNIHGFGGNHHQFERNTDDFLKLGYAVASLDYRLTPPCTYEAPVWDAKACIRYLKAHADELSLDPERIGVMGGSMGGYLSGMIAASNGEPAIEGNIGGNVSVDSSVRASMTAFGPMELLTFGDDCEHIWPGQPEKRANGDGPFAPPASMIGYVGYGKGVADLKKHLSDPDPAYKELLQLLNEASPISHVTENSAPICLVHGIFDCGIQVPMGQSVRMFEAYTQKGVKSLLLCNNNGMYGDDPEVKEAVIRFMKDRV